MKKILKRDSLTHILIYLCRPFTEGLSLLLTFFAFTTLLELYADLFFPFETSYRAFLTIIRGFIDSYIFTLVYLLLSPTIRKYYLVVIGFIVGLFYIIDLFLVVSFNRAMDADSVCIMLATNPSEIQEFFDTYFTKEIFLTLILFIFLLILFNFLSKRRSIVGHKTSVLLFVTFLMALSINIYKGGLGMIPRKIEMVLSLPSMPSDLSTYYQNPQIQVVDKQPQNIVVIIGESYTKTHSSLYGYEYSTNPYLEKLHKDSALFLFNNVRSEATYTTKAFKSFMSTYKVQYGDKVNWYECLSLPEVISLASYTSSWISNQSEFGVYDNIATMYSKICDNSCFVGNKVSGINKKDYDELVLAPLNSMPKDSQSFFFVHLMGSHHDYDKRYPKQFNHFSESDYIQYPLQQRKKRATYDNSVLYNDSIVYEVIDMFKDREAIILYFSDHALDIYDSSETFCGHANQNDSISYKAGTSIPFMIYLSRLYKNNFPQHTKKIIENTNTDYSTENLIYTIMDIMGVKFKENNDVNHYSLLQ